jgi:hypothetical protein
MSRFFAVCAAGAFVALATWSVAKPSVAAEGLSCEIKIAKRGGVKSLEAFVSASSPVVGSYRLSATPMTGGADIDQSGAFAAKPGAPVSLGTMALVSAATRYSAVLTVKGSDGVVACTTGADAN